MEVNVPPLLAVQHLTCDFDGVRAVDGLSFELSNGITALIGANGSGKSTIFNAISGYVKPTSGSIYLQGKNIVGMSPDQIVRAGIGRTFQNIRLLPQMSVLENLLIALDDSQLTNLRSIFFSLARVRAAEARNKDRALELLEFVGLSAKQSELAGSLSYGQRKLVEIARALALDSKLLLLDEPMAGLVAERIKQIQGMLHKIAESKAILFVEHNVRVVMDISTRIIVLGNGRKVAEGKPNQIQNDASVIAAYLGRTGPEKRN